MIRGIALVLLMAGLTQAQQKPPQPETEMPISQYMRKVTLIYLEQIDSFDDRCKDHDSCKEVVGATSDGDWDKIFKPLDDRVVISLGDSPTPGDKQSWAFLKSVKDSAWFLLSSKMLWFGDIEDHRDRDETVDRQRTKDWAGIFTKCYSDADEAAISGHTMVGAASDCDTKILDQIKKQKAK